MEGDSGCIARTMPNYPRSQCLLYMCVFTVEAIEGIRPKKTWFKVQMTYTTVMSGRKSIELMVARERHESILWFQEKERCNNAISLIYFKLLYYLHSKSSLFTLCL